MRSRAGMTTMLEACDETRALSGSFRGGDVMISQGPRLKIRNVSGVTTTYFTLPLGSRSSSRSPMIMAWPSDSIM